MIPDITKRTIVSQRIEYLDEMSASGLKRRPLFIETYYSDGSMDVDHYPTVPIDFIKIDLQLAGLQLTEEATNPEELITPRDLEGIQND